MPTTCRRALHQGEDRGKDRHRRAHQGRAAHLPADLQRHRPEDRRQRFRPPVPGRRALQDRRPRAWRCSTRPGIRRPDVSYKIEDAVFVGDTLFMPDYGTARADFPGGDAHQLYRSIKRLLRAAPGNAPIHVPRLQGARPRRLCLGDNGSAEARRECARPRTA